MDSSNCLQCPQGQYQDEYAQTECKSCAKNMFSDGGTTACAECAFGQYRHAGLLSDLITIQPRPDNAIDTGVVGQYRVPHSPSTTVRVGNHVRWTFGTTSASYKNQREFIVTRILRNFNLDNSILYSTSFGGISMASGTSLAQYTEVSTIPQTAHDQYLIEGDVFRVQTDGTWSTVTDTSIRVVWGNHNPQCHICNTAPTVEQGNILEVLNRVANVHCQICTNTSEYFSEDGECIPFGTPCSPGSYHIGSNECATCPVGWASPADYTFCPTGGDVATCPTDTVTVQERRWCVQCQEYEYPDPLNGFCSKCEPGFHNSNAAATCESCPAGKYHDADSAYPDKCRDCPGGWSQSAAGRRWCGKCGHGTYSTPTSCPDCPAGYDSYSRHLEFADSVAVFAQYASQQCLECTWGRYSKQGGRGETVWIRQGGSNPTASSNCKQCSGEGQYQDEKQASGCKSCTAAGLSATPIAVVHAWVKDYSVANNEEYRVTWAKAHEQKWIKCENATSLLAPIRSSLDITKAKDQYWDKSQYEWTTVIAWPSEPTLKTGGRRLAYTPVKHDRVQRLGSAHDTCKTDVVGAASQYVSVVESLLCEQSAPLEFNRSAISSLYLANVRVPEDLTKAVCTSNIDVDTWTCTQELADPQRSIYDASGLTFNHLKSIYNYEQCEPEPFCELNVEMGNIHRWSCITDGVV